MFVIYAFEPVRLLMVTPLMVLPSMLPVKSIFVFPPAPSLFKIYNDLFDVA